MPHTALSVSPLALMTAPVRHAWEYAIDASQRTVLFWDVLRRRSNQYYRHRSRKVPHVLHFGVEVILDGRTFEKPVNYMLAWIEPPEGTVFDPRKRPFVVIDPRAGHGPGIGGFKLDSEVGMAMRAGHPCYFIGFTPNPMPGQTIEDIVRAEAAFLEEIVERHPQAEGRPCIVGNCQAGWAVMMLAAMRPELPGPIIVAGAPLSYWAGLERRYPMRYSGGLLGGSWLAALASDLGNGKFDGSYLVGNFENLNPANTIWNKNYNLWAKVDAEAERFLEFETWWGGHVDLDAGEIQWIVDKLFVGNRLATAEITTSDGIRIDLRNIRSPIVCFCSEGDNITPPQQALGWIVDLYDSEDDLTANGQTIVYAVHENIGHLGIFVSAGVARKEHEEFTSNIDLIDILTPGIYEAVISPKADDTVNPELADGNWITSFEPRTLDDIRAIVRPSEENELRFATVRRVSDINLGLYRTFLQPCVRAAATEQSAFWMHKLNPSELPFEVFSDSNPLMNRVAGYADVVRENRMPVSPDNPWPALQESFSIWMTALLDAWRSWRDWGLENAFLAVYSAPLVQAMAGMRATPGEGPRRRPGIEPERIKFVKGRIAEIKACIAKGDLVTAAVRSLVYIAMGGTGVDKRHFEVLRRIHAEYGVMSLAEYKKAVREQLFSLTLDSEAALAAIPAMLPPNADARRETLDVIRRIVSAAGKPTGEAAKRLARVEKLFATPGPASKWKGQIRVVKTD